MKNKELEVNDLLYQDIESKIATIKGKKRNYMLLYRTTKVLAFMAGASITILTGCKINDGVKFNFDNYILVTSACITLLTALDGLFTFKDKGKGYDLLLFDLRRLRDRICYDFSKDKDFYKKRKDDHFKDYQTILISQKEIIEGPESKKN